MNGNKIDITESEMQPGKFRVIVNVTDEYSVGIILTRGELKTLFSDIQNVLKKLK